MFYTHEITVSANTAETSADELEVKLTAGVITQVSFRPRPGHAALCHCQVFYHGLQIFPINRGEDLHGDTFPIEWNDFIELNSQPYVLKIKSWNEDDTYAHTFDISFSVLPKAVLIPFAIAKVISDIVGILNPKRIFGGG